MTVNLTRIYTKLGDGGETDLGDRSRVSRTTRGSRPTARSTSWARTSASRCPTPGCRRATASWLRRIQNDLFDVGADLAVPALEGLRRRERRRERLRRSPTWLEHALRRGQRRARAAALVPALRRHAGRGLAARLPHRLPARRAALVAVGEEASPEALRYLNRLSDLLFILARDANQDQPKPERVESRPIFPGRIPRFLSRRPLERSHPGLSQRGLGPRPESEPLWNPGAHARTPLRSRPELARIGLAQARDGQRRPHVPTR